MNPCFSIGNKNARARNTVSCLPSENRDTPLVLTRLCLLQRAPWQGVTDQGSPRLSVKGFDAAGRAGRNTGVVEGVKRLIERAAVELVDLHGRRRRKATEL